MATFVPTGRMHVRRKENTWVSNVAHPDGDEFGISFLVPDRAPRDQHYDSSVATTRSTPQNCSHVLLTESEQLGARHKPVTRTVGKPRLLNPPNFQCPVFKCRNISSSSNLRVLIGKLQKSNNEGEGRRAYLASDESCLQNSP